MREKFLHFMQGRYGADQLYRVMLIGGAVLSFYQTYFEVFFLLLGWILVVLAFVRAFSKDYSRRYAESLSSLSNKSIRSYIAGNKTCKIFEKESND